MRNGPSSRNKGSGSCAAGCSFIVNGSIRSRLVISRFARTSSGVTPKKSRKGAGKGFMGAITDIERYRKDVRRALRQHMGSLGEASPAQVARNRQARYLGEYSRKMEPR